MLLCAPQSLPFSPRVQLKLTGSKQGADYGRNRQKACPPNSRDLLEGLCWWACPGQGREAKLTAAAQNAARRLQTSSGKGVRPPEQAPPSPQRKPRGSAFSFKRQVEFHACLCTARKQASVPCWKSVCSDSIPQPTPSMRPEVSAGRGQKEGSHDGALKALTVFHVHCMCDAHQRQAELGCTIAAAVLTHPRGYLCMRPQRLAGGARPDYSTPTLPRRPPAASLVRPVAFAQMILPCQGSSSTPSGSSRCLHGEKVPSSSGLSATPQSLGPSLTI